MNILIISNYKEDKNNKTSIDKYLGSLISGFLDLNHNIYFGGGEPDKVYIDPLFPNIINSKNLFKIKFEEINNFSLFNYILTDLRIFNADNNLHRNRWINLNDKIINSNLQNKHCILHFADCSNRGYFSDGLFQQYPCRTIVKRETSINEWPDVLPLDMAINPEWNQNLKKDIFVSCLFGSNSGSRTKGHHRANVAKSIKTKFPSSPVCLGFNNSGDRFCNQNEYFNILSRSKISVSCWGAGYSCYRDWEILSCDTILAFKRMPNPHLDDYVDMESCIKYDKPEELIQKLIHLESNPDEVERIRQNSIKITNEFNLPKHRAQKLINAIESGIPKPSWV